MLDKLSVSIVQHYNSVVFPHTYVGASQLEMFHNYAWQGRILEVREDRGYIDNEIHSCNYGHTIHHYGNNTTKTTQPNTAPVNTQYYNHMYANQVSVSGMHFFCSQSIC